MGIPLWRDTETAPSSAAACGAKPYQAGCPARRERLAGAYRAISSRDEYLQMAHAQRRAQATAAATTAGTTGTSTSTTASYLGPWERRLMRVQDGVRDASVQDTEVPVRVINQAPQPAANFPGEQLTTRLHEIERRLRQTSPTGQHPVDRLRISRRQHSSEDASITEDSTDPSSPRSASRRNVARHMGDSPGMSANEAEHRAVLARLARHIIRSPMGSREYLDELRDYRYAQLYLNELNSLRSQPRSAGQSSGTTAGRQRSHRRRDSAASAVRMERSSDSNEDDELIDNMDLDLDDDEVEIVPRPTDNNYVHDQLVHADRILHDQLRSSAEHAPDPSTFSHGSGSARDDAFDVGGAQAAATTLQGQLDNWRRTRQMQHERVERLVESANQAQRRQQRRLNSSGTSSVEQQQTRAALMRSAHASSLPMIEGEQDVHMSTIPGIEPVSVSSTAADYAQQRQQVDRRDVFL